jgi:hypothetical protein
MDTAHARSIVLQAMFPSLPAVIVENLAAQNDSLDLGVAQCNSLLHPRINLHSLKRLLDQPSIAGAFNEVRTAVQDSVELVGSEVYDVPNATEYATVIVPVPLSDHSITPLNWVSNGREKPELTARKYCSPEEAPETKALVNSYADVFDPDSMQSSLARELYRHYHLRHQEVNEVIPQILPFIRKVVIGQVVIPQMSRRHVDLPLLGRIPFTTEAARIVAADIPDEGAVVIVNCEQCFRIRLRQVKFDLEPCHFTYYRNGRWRSGILDIIVKRAHLRLGLDVYLSAWGKRTAQVFLARLRLKKFSLRARMKYSPLVNAFLSLARNFIKDAIEEELAKSLLGKHSLDF